MNCAKVDLLQSLAQERPNVKIYPGDCNKILLEDVFPQIRYDEYKRALCILDPYGLHLNWEIIKKAAEMKTIEIFLNFPIMDMNMNVLKRDKSTVLPSQLERMNKFWGDQSWEEAAYDTEYDLFGFPEKTDNDSIVAAFQKRLKTVAGFKYVPKPLAMHNTSNAIVYYLFFASHNETGYKIANHIF